MKKLTQTQKELISKLKCAPYTAEYVEEWINRKDTVYENAPAALTSMAAHGFYTAVTAFEKNRQDYDYKILARGICIACGQIMEEDMNNAIDTVISVLDSAGIDRAEAERCGVNKFDLERLEAVFCKMEAQE